MDALQSLHNGSLTGQRLQTVLTPPLILDPLRAAWGGQIVCDPSAPPRQMPVTCSVCNGLRCLGDIWCPGCNAMGMVWVPCTSFVNALVEYRVEDNGLAQIWPDRTYCNPEYEVLEPWLAPQATGRTAWLIPVRPHRRWWRAWARTCDTIIYLDPFAFVGHDQVFPAPLCLGYRGPDFVTIAAAFAGLGEPI